MFQLFATGVADIGGKFSAGIVDTGGKFANGGAPWHANISANFRFKGLGGRCFMKKTWSKKSRDTVPLRLVIFGSKVLLFYTHITEQTIGGTRKRRLALLADGHLVRDPKQFFGGGARRQQHC